MTRKTRLIDVVYNASNNELVRTKTLVKGAVVQVDATPFRQWWEAHYGQVLGKRKASAKNAAASATVVAETKPVCKATEEKRVLRAPLANVDPILDDQFATGRLYAKIASRPGQSGRCDGYILEGKELEFYLKKIKSKK